MGVDTDKEGKAYHFVIKIIFQLNKYLYPSNSAYWVCVNESAWKNTLVKAADV